MLSRRGDVLVSQTQRSRMLNSAVAVISEHGYSEMSVSRITAGAGVSRRTFYDLFQDREDCFLAAFDEAVARAQTLMLDASAQQREWRERIRAALHTLLELLDREPAFRRLLVVDALQAGPRVQYRRAEILGELSRLLHATGSRGKSARKLPELTGEGIIGAVFGVIHTRLQTRRPGSMTDLLNPLMGVIVLPYLGHAAAQRELTRPAPDSYSPPRQTRRAHPGDPLAGLPMRVTYRTLVVLQAIAERPGASNRQISDVAGVPDQGQISKLLSRLEGLGLIENTGEGQPSGEPNAWRLALRGRQVQQAMQLQAGTSEIQSNGERKSYQC